MAITLRAARPSRSPIRTLRAGTLNCELHQGDLRYVRLGEVELLRRIYFIARDLNWGNIPQAISAPRITTGRYHFEVNFKARSLAPGVHIDWACCISGNHDGTITYSVSGRALTPFMANRVGLCVHLPLAGFVGTRHDLIDGSNQTHVLALTRTVSPHPPGTSIGALRFRLPHGARLKLDFSGEDFEMEDQRNWIDGSFKVYSRPLSRPFPFEVRAGDAFTQTVRVSASARPARALRRPSPHPLIRIGRVGRHAAPAIGTSLPPPAFGPRQPVVRALASLGLRHLRGDIDDFGRGLSAQLTHATRAARSLKVPLELAIFLSANAPQEARALARALDFSRPAVTRFLVFGADTLCTPSAALRAARSALIELYPSSGFAVGTDFNFAELNRGRKTLPTAGTVTYSANPQTHAGDELSIVECLEGLRHSIASARIFFPRSTLGISVLTLKPRKNAAATVREPVSPARRYDPRQGSAFCAAWTVAALGILQEAGVASATLYESAGAGGLASTAGRLHPVGAAIAAYLACDDQGVRPMWTSHPLRVGGWARAKTACIANLTAEPQTATVELPNGTLRRLRLRPHALQPLKL